MKLTDYIRHRMVQYSQRQLDKPVHEDQPMIYPEEIAMGESLELLDEAAHVSHHARLRAEAYQDVLVPICAAQAALVSHLEGELPMAGVIALAELQKAAEQLHRHLISEGRMLDGGDH